MHDFGLFTWDPITFKPLIVHWKEDLPYLLVAAFWFSIMGRYMVIKGRRLEQEGELAATTTGSINANRGS